MDKEKLVQFYNSHKGGVNGAIVGFVLASVILIIGFLNTLFIAIFVGIGYYIGKKLSEDKEYIKNLLDKILPPGTYR
ncbi:small integral membrane protein DUF2273 [Anaerobacterium chartisolvens]|uniref:Small integral membrane protein DUF2273 n=1 Tax=Anaerobacterium chartisolvens TaxID=1297424 RepID=A0A369B5J8_9FIRM|nr:DUF2273 domain-containing protein [Anaerobacterium chartisolvens]RCX16799.1 small integral membrane protein DUF2273 [Anaerobacterium chartisolvens]